MSTFNHQQYATLVANLKHDELVAEAKTVLVSIILPAGDMSDKILVTKEDVSRLLVLAVALTEEVERLGSEVESCYPGSKRRN